MLRIGNRKRRAIGRRFFYRKPDFIIGGNDDPYLLRWHLLPRNRFFNVYLHKFLRDDDDRALHDHPWASVSILLKGSYLEHFPDGTIKRRNTGVFIYRRAEHIHRIELLKKASHSQPVWTLFITGLKVREWGFYCPQGWRHWKDFTNAADGGATVGRGCE